MVVMLLCSRVQCICRNGGDIVFYKTGFAFMEKIMVIYLVVANVTGLVS